MLINNFKQIEYNTTQEIQYHTTEDDQQKIVNFEFLSPSKVILVQCGRLLKLCVQSSLPKPITQGSGLFGLNMR